ncbi:hypothetical protein WOLCODRAFT_160397 [Wolfiporia cocos MD-104 SS10]|uniref:Sec39 domain-containing protein n=1 Tax=Wolfiporia cocos (strain MD-104) TaxID=742152 RepID=A0A2H3IV34_WOLCO|nr:hypothetical protein WOLCODRAFT_160397 [Wolfiporia cocos MD-104 SS10]
MASPSTTTSPEDLCAQWTALSDEDLTAEKVNQLLKPVPDDLWVAAACLDRVLDDAPVQRSLLDLGLERSQPALTRSQAAFDSPAEAVGDEDDEDEGGEIREGQDRRHAALVSHFRAEPRNAQLCRIRAVLLDRLDKLSTFVEICKEAPFKEDVVDPVDAEWEDDPWADEANDPPAESAPSASLPGAPPIPLPAFLQSDLLQLACLLASLEHIAALRILMERHGAQLWPYRFQILDSIPEHALSEQLRDVLPSYDPSEDREVKAEPKPWRSEVDFSESSELHKALVDSEVALNVEPPPRIDSSEICPEPLSPSNIAAWYQKRIDLVISNTGLIDAALSLVQHAASQGLPGLDELGEELSLLSRLVYDAPSSAQYADDDWTLARWKNMDPPAIVRAYLAHTTPETVARDIRRLVMPYLFVLESRAERAGAPDPTLPTRLLYKYILSAPLGIVAAVFEASNPTLAPVQRLIRDDEDMARLALACLYGSDSLNEWPTMSHIFECLPAWDTTQDEDEADEADTTIASLGAFVTPSTTRPRCTPADLMLFFKPLPSSALSRALDVLDVHLESGEILARWSVPAPLRWFLQSNGNIAEQRSWANRMARRAGESQDKLETREDWEWLLEDMVKLSDSGESGSWSAFCLLSKDDIVRIFFSGLLSTGKFDIARALLRSSSVNLSLDSAVIEDICLTCSQEFYDNASSGNYHFGDMKLAYDCLDIPPASPRIVKEKEFIEATTRLCSFNLMSRPGIPITPLEIRLTKDRLSLVSRVLSSNNDAYKHTQVILDLVHKLGFRGDVVAEAKALAMLAETALQAEDFPRAYEASTRMVDAVLALRTAAPAGLRDPRADEASEVCWVACFSIGRHPEFADVQKRLALLGRALELCPPDRLADVLAAWRGQLRMPELHMPHSPLASAPDAAALANKAFSRVAANFPFSVGHRGRQLMSEDENSWERSRSGSRSRADGADVSAQASRVLQAGIGWLLGADDDS